MAELCAIYDGLKMSYSLGLRRILVESDLLCAVQLIHRWAVAHHFSLSMIRVIKELMARDWSVEVKHIFREVNQCADMLARRGHDIHLEVSFMIRFLIFFLLFLLLIWPG